MAELEASVLGALLLDWAAAQAEPGVSSLYPDAFVRSCHRVLYEAMVEMRAAGLDVTLPNVTDYLRERHRLDAAGGAGYVTKVLASAPATFALLGSRVASLKRIAACRALETLALTILHEIKQREYAAVEELCAFAMNVARAVTDGLPDRALLQARLRRAAGGHRSGTPR